MIFLFIYLDNISTSALTLSPFINLPRVVISYVCGIIFTVNLFFKTPFIVNDTPSIVIEPFSQINFSIFFGAVKLTKVDFLAF